MTSPGSAFTVKRATSRRKICATCHTCEWHVMLLIPVCAIDCVPARSHPPQITGTTHHTPHSPRCPSPSGAPVTSSAKRAAVATTVSADRITKKPPAAVPRATHPERPACTPAATVIRTGVLPRRTPGCRASRTEMAGKQAACARGALSAYLTNATSDEVAVCSLGIAAGRTHRGDEADRTSGGAAGWPRVLKAYDSEIPMHTGCPHSCAAGLGSFRGDIDCEHRTCPPG
ncbi:hypothetical protein WOLCODRAFT_162167 [Wolfiporia cocos MD-104 SS10]|uniref:Uncharacterized protein n=1 Tax=Wolfiporia cocos (strain MD-104) TaxID=742152 RepID=A0A2H3JK09_WOLCO|nr:hypothetical protein WOLCODRAFT_162167 [Wolfiporia cocos MD-104 SS10]